MICLQGDKYAYEPVSLSKLLLPEYPLVDLQDALFMIVLSNTSLPLNNRFILQSQKFNNELTWKGFIGLIMNSSLREQRIGKNVNLLKIHLHFWSYIVGHFMVPIFLHLAYGSLGTRADIPLSLKFIVQQLSLIFAALGLKSLVVP